MLNAAAWSVAGLRRSDHITDTLASFHWLSAPERVKFKLAVIVYMGGAIGGGQGGHGPSNNLVGGAILYLAPQYFALEFKILTLDLMQREENMFRVPLCWMCVHCKIHYTY